MSAKQRILDAAAQVMREQGMARATTKEIARVAGCSEALLYKHFRDKQDIFVRVLSERLPQIAEGEDLVGSATVEQNLRSLVTSLVRFYEQSFPIAVSVFSSAELLALQREVLRSRGAGPAVPAARVEAYLAGEQAGGRVHAGIDAAATARVLAGAALFEGFLATFEAAPITEPDKVAGRIVATVLPSLTPG